VALNIGRRLLGQRVHDHLDSARGAVSAEVRQAPWVAPDYAGIPADGDLPHDRAERTLVWPGPALVMPAGLLPDGCPHGRNEEDNAERISGVRPRNFQDADACVIAYNRQQRALRRAAGLPAPTRVPPRFELTDTPETLAAIAEIHARERARRAKASGAG
jgi:hypothetical protein